jgi:hypothetical protein
MSSASPAPNVPKGVVVTAVMADTATAALAAETAEITANQSTII